MAKRGRKKKSKITGLSAVDKGHLKRILGKVRQIKANKAAASPAPGKVATGNPQLLAAWQSAQADLNNFIKTGNPNNPQYNVIFTQKANFVAMAQAKYLASFK